MRLQWRRLLLYRIRLSVRRRIQCGMGRFELAALANVRFVLKLLWLGMVSVVGPGSLCFS